MPTLAETFQDYEADQIEMIAEQWGIEENLTKEKNTDKALIDFLTDEDLFLEIVETLPKLATQAMQSLVKAGGKIARGQFEREFGELREMGAAIREKERPDRNPISTAERLYYRGLIGLAFFDEPGGTMEFYFLPNEFLKSLEKIGLAKAKRNPIPLATSQPKGKLVSASDSILDSICLTLSALRGMIPHDEIEKILSPGLYQFSLSLLKVMEVISEDLKIQEADLLRQMLIEPRGSLHLTVFNHWKNTTNINELREAPGLIFEGKWKNDPVQPRAWLLERLKELKADAWVPVEGFVKWVHTNHPDILRSGGEYDSWFIREEENSDYLQGFSHWGKIEGAYLHNMLTKILHWIGILDTVVDKETKAVLAFRKSIIAESLFNNTASENGQKEQNQFTLQKNGRILIENNCSREVRYQIGRFCAWEGKRGNHTHFSINHTAMERAKAQKIAPEQIKKLLRKHAQKPIPENIFSAINRWSKRKEQTALEGHMLIRVKNKSMLDRIMAGPAKRYLQERLNEHDAILKEKDTRKFAELLTEMGIFIENKPAV